MRLRRSDPARHGFTRKGRRYLDESGTALRDSAEVERINALAIPPAWSDVWICPDPKGHIQAAGTDAAGRRQYIYHQAWRQQRDAEKHARTLALASSLPRARKVTTAALKGSSLDFSRVMATAFRVLDIASPRIGSESYAAEHETYGLATLRRRDVDVTGTVVSFRFVGKGGIAQEFAVRNPSLARSVNDLLARKDRGKELLAWQDDDGWHDVRSTDINAHIKDVTRGDFTAKDFRTWNATVLMAQVLSLAGLADGERARKTIANAYATVADYLGNTPAIARSSYVDSRLVDLYADGVILPAKVLPKAQRHLPIHGRVERAVLSMLSDPRR